MRAILGSLLGLLAVGSGVAAEPVPIGVPIRYTLPADGSPSKSWRVTLAIVDPKNPDWIISQFAAGVPRTVTSENGGKFSEVWDELPRRVFPSIAIT